MGADRFVLLGESLALDLVNTVVAAGGGTEDLLASPGDLAAWVALHGDQLPVPPVRFTRRDLDTVRTLRSEVASALEAARRGRRPLARALASLTAAMQAGAAHRELGWDGHAVTAGTRRAGGAVVQILGALADAAADLLASREVTDVRRCERPDCVMVFRATHPTRRWCTPTCGNRARVARHYARHRGASG